MQRKLAKSRSNPTARAPLPTYHPPHSARHFQFPFALICLGFFVVVVVAFCRVTLRICCFYFGQVQSGSTYGFANEAVDSCHSCCHTEPPQMQIQTERQEQTDAYMIESGLRDQTAPPPPSPHLGLRLRHVCHINFNRSARKCVSL